MKKLLSITNDTFRIGQCTPLQTRRTADFKNKWKQDIIDLTSPSQSNGADCRVVIRWWRGEHCRLCDTVGELTWGQTIAGATDLHPGQPGLSVYWLSFSLQLSILFNFYLKLFKSFIQHCFMQYGMFATMSCCVTVLKRPQSYHC